MTEPALPNCVLKRDGRMVPFEADRISRALFAATEELGKPDAFLARELADGAAHFLAAECEGQIPTTQQIADVVVKVVRELGHPALSSAFESHRNRASRLARAHADARRGHALSAVYTRDLTAAQEAGLLTLTDLDAPDELAGRVAERGPDGRPQLRASARLVAVDGLDYFAALTGLSVSDDASLGAGAVVNLNGADAPSWAGPLAVGPLFTQQPRRIDRDRLAEAADGLCDELIRSGQCRIDWHLGEADFAPDRRERLERLATLARGPIRFVFDRPRRPVALAEGLDRRHGAALSHVELQLPALAKQGGLLADVDRFCQRLGSLARLALSAAVQKRDHLRKAAPELTRGFLLDRARLVVVPVGLDEVVRLYTDWGLANGGPSLELGRRIVGRLLDVLRGDGRLAQMDACIDGPATFPPCQRERVPGLTPWDDRASVSSQLRAAGALHSLAELGTLALHLPTGEPLADVLHQAWRQTEVVRLRVV
jgi:hypothetical protein